MSFLDRKETKPAPPQHIAIIMDGNGRWAKKRGLPRTAGHSAGAESFRRIANYCRKIGVKYLTVYAFSTENWKRSVEEVSGIMKLLGAYLKEVDGSAFMAELKANGKAVFALEGEEIVLEMDDVLYDTAQKGGFVSSTNNNLTVVLDTNLTPELVEEGFVREIISKVQTMRKEADFNVTDRIKVYHDGNAKIAEILAANDITGDVLADEVVAGAGGELSKEWNINGEKVTLGVARV